MPGGLTRAAILHPLELPRSVIRKSKWPAEQLWTIPSCSSHAVFERSKQRLGVAATRAPLQAVRIPDAVVSATTYSADGRYCPRRGERPSFSRVVRNTLRRRG